MTDGLQECLDRFEQLTNDTADILEAVRRADPSERSALLGRLTLSTGKVLGGLEMLACLHPEEVAYAQQRAEAVVEAITRVRGEIESDGL